MDRIIEIFEKAKALRPGPERDQTIRQACGDNMEMYREVQSLLVSDREAQGFLDTPAAQKIDLDTVAVGPLKSFAQAGDIIGPYKLLEQIGEGGFGVVWMAEQKTPLRRRVAVKLIKPGMDSKQVLGRFEAERQALAMMDHPNIATILDAGVSPEGRPYFAMELVRGIPITQYCSEEDVDIPKRLALFATICHAVQHAHQKGIIHRDLKPNNVLVTLHDGVPLPKIIDFGIAKAMHQDLTDMTVFTRLHEFLGTPEYTSPEQVEFSGLDMDTRSDIYSLGMILYELLTDTPAFDNSLRRSSPQKIREIIRNTTPARPSIVAARANQNDNMRLTQTPSKSPIPRDLDLIVMKCLEKDRNRRYPTAISLAEDVTRYLNNQPIEARPPSPLYLFRRAWKRHRAAMSSAVAITVSIVIALIVSVSQTIASRRAAKEAKYYAEQATLAKEDATQKAQATKLSEEATRSALERLQHQERRNRKIIYALDMNQAQQEIEKGQFPNATQRLKKYIPASGETDLRGWEWRRLWELSRPQHNMLLGPTKDRIISLACTADGDIAVVGKSTGISFFSIESGKLLFTSAEDLSTVKVATHPQENLLAAQGQVIDPTSPDSPSRKGELRFIRMNTGLVTTMAAKPTCVALQFTEDGKYLVIVENDSRSQPSSLRLLESETFEVISEYSLEDSLHNWIYTRPITISADNSFIIYGATNHKIVSRDLISGTVIWSVDPTSVDLPDAMAYSVRLADDDRLVAAKRLNKTAIFDAATGELLRTFRQPASIFDLPGGANEIVYGDRGALRSRSTQGDETFPSKAAHANFVWVPFAKRPGTNEFLGVHRDDSICLWDTEPVGTLANYGNVPLNGEEGRQNLDWSFGIDRQIHTVSASGKVATHDLNNPQVQKSWNLPIRATKASFLPDGSQLAVADEDSNTISVFDTASSVIIEQVDVELSGVEAINFSKAEPTLRIFERVSQGHSAQTQVTLIHNFERTQTYDTNAQDAQWLWGIEHSWSFSPNGNFMLTDHRIKNQHRFDIWNVADWTLAGSHEFTWGNLYAPAVSPSGKHVSYANNISVGLAEDAPSFNELHVGTVRSYSHDGTRIAILNGNQVHLWDPTSGQSTLSLTPLVDINANFLLELRFSPDDRHIGLRTTTAIHVWTAPDIKQLEVAASEN